MDEPVSALDRLRSLVRTVEVKQKSSKVTQELDLKATILIEAFRTYRQAQDALDAIDLDAVEAVKQEENEFKSLTSQVAKLRANMEPEEWREVERETLLAQDDIRTRRIAAVDGLKSAQERRDSTFKAASDLIPDYRRAYQAAEQLLPGEPDKNPLVQRVEPMIEILLSQTPWGQFCNLRKDVFTTESRFHLIPRRIAFCTMKVWIGTYRKIQEVFNNLPKEAYTRDQFNEVAAFFDILAGISKRHKPGYVDAFQHGFNADWDRYLAMAKEELDMVSHQPDTTP